jgi:hypothetical protein
MSRALPSRLARAAVLAAALCCGLDCGAGIYDGKGSAEITRLIDRAGGEISLGQARLLIGPGVLLDPTAVTLRRIPSVEHSGAYGPVFEIQIPVPGLFQHDPTLEILVPSIGINQASLTLGVLDPSLPPDVVQWVPISSAHLDPTQTLVQGPVQGFANKPVLQFGAVVRCAQLTVCPEGQACNSGACQQCPVGSCT